MGLMTLELNQSQALVIKECLEKQAFLLQKHIESMKDVESIPDEVKDFNRWKLNLMNEVSLQMIISMPISANESRLGEQFILYLDATQKKTEGNENH